MSGEPVDHGRDESGAEIDEGDGRGEAAHWCYVRPTDVASDAAWEPIKALLDKHCESYRAEDVRAAVGSGHLQAWVVRERGGLLAVMLTQIVRRRDYSALVVTHIGGTGLRKWIRDWHLLRRYAAENGCSSVEGYGRDGWLRLIPAERIGIAWRMRL